MVKQLKVLYACDGLLQIFAKLCALRVLIQGKFPEHFVHVWHISNFSKLFSVFEKTDRKDSLPIKFHHFHHPIEL